MLSSVVEGHLLPSQSAEFSADCDVEGCSKEKGIGSLDMCGARAI